MQGFVVAMSVLVFPTVLLGFLAMVRIDFLEGRVKELEERLPNTPKEPEGV